MAKTLEQDIIISFQELGITKEHAAFNRNTPFANSEIFKGRFTSFTKLTHGEDVKNVYLATIQTDDIRIDYNIGDTIGIFPENNEDEVEKVINILDLRDAAEKIYEINFLDKIPKAYQLPLNCSLKELLTKYVSIRGIPKKGFLRSLISFTSDCKEIDELESLSSPKSVTYNTFVASKHAYSLLNLFNYFKTCKPDLQFLLTRLSILKPRYYSIINSPLEKGHASIVFSVENVNKGVCSGYLENIGHNFKDKSEVEFYYRKSNGFLDFNGTEKPVILVACGTGIAPYLGLLKEKEIRKSDYEISLFYGCRYKDRDFLFNDVLKRYERTGVLNKLIVAFSRDNQQKVYVQHKLKEHSQFIMDSLINRDAILCICGAINVQKCIEQCLVECLIDERGYEQQEASDFLLQLKMSNRIQTDVWS